MVKEEDITYEIISEGDVPQEVIDDIKAGMLDEEQAQVDVTELTELTIKIEGVEELQKIIGLKSMLHDEHSGDMTIRMIAAQILENQHGRETTEGEAN